MPEMQRSAGARLGPYQITGPIGAGGMGEVYRARDTRLDRDVAIKLLSARRAADAEHRQRFEREARAISSLNDPHICSLYDVGWENGTPFLVMELLEGETLEARLNRGALPLEEALTIAIQVGSALDQAHRRGIVHRDLKPGNIMITGPKSAPAAKLLDFGLAKGAPTSAAAAPGTLLATIADTVTSHGTIVGTFQYMAPEQLEGRECDARTDLFAFGAVLYETIAGRRAFQAQSQASLISAIMTADPPAVSTLQKMTPPALDRAIRKCLAKDPDDRWQSARDLVSELKWIAEGGSQAGVPAVVAAHRKSRAKTGRLLAAVGGAALLGLLAVAILHFRETESQPSAVRFTVSPPDKFTFEIYSRPTLSPDGRSIAFTATKPDRHTALFTRSLDAVEARELPGVEDAYFPFWSPDSRNIGFYAGGKLKRFELSSGSVVSLADIPAGPGGTWNRDGVILFTSGTDGAIRRVSASGGTPAPATRVDLSKGEVGHLWPQFLPDGRHFLYYASSSNPQTRGVCIGSLGTTEVTRLFDSETAAIFAEPGYLLFARANTLTAQPFDPKRLRLTGDPFPVVEQVEVMPVVFHATVSAAAGVLAYRTGGHYRLSPAWFDRSGKRGAPMGEPGDYSNPALSPDGRTVAVGLRDEGTKTRDIWLFDLVRGAKSRFTLDPADDLNPTWSPDGSRIAFASNRKGQRDLWVKAASGVGPEEVLLESEFQKNAEDWSHDGRYLIFNYRQPAGLVEIWALPWTGDRKPFPVVSGPYSAEQGQLSPDGRFIAYRSTESGRYEVYAQNFPPSGGKWPVSTAGGAEPQWRRDGRELFYLQDERLMAVDVKPGGTKFEAGIPHELFQLQLGPSVRNRYLASPDGKRFLAMSRDDTGPATPVTVVLNWLATVKR